MLPTSWVRHCRTMTIAMATAGVGTARPSEWVYVDAAIPPRIEGIRDLVAGNDLLGEFASIDMRCESGGKCEGWIGWYDLGGKAEWSAYTLTTRGDRVDLKGEVRCQNGETTVRKVSVVDGVMHTGCGEAPIRVVKLPAMTRTLVANRLRDLAVEKFAPVLGQTPADMCEATAIGCQRDDIGLVCTVGPERTRFVWQSPLGATVADVIGETHEQWGGMCKGRLLLPGWNPGDLVRPVPPTEGYRIGDMFIPR